MISASQIGHNGCFRVIFHDVKHITLSDAVASKLARIVVVPNLQDMTSDVGRICE